MIPTLVRCPTTARSWIHPTMTHTLRLPAMANGIWLNVARPLPQQHSFPRWLLAIAAAPRSSRRIIVGKSFTATSLCGRRVGFLRSTAPWFDWCIDYVFGLIHYSDFAAPFGDGQQAAERMHLEAEEMRRAGRDSSALSRERRRHFFHARPLLKTLALCARLFPNFDVTW